MQRVWDGEVHAPDRPDVCATPLVVQLTDDDGDGRVDQSDVPDVVFFHRAAAVCSLTAVDGGRGDVHFTVDDRPLKATELAAGDLDGDGVVEIIATDQADRFLVAYEHDGSLHWVGEDLGEPGPLLRNDAPGVADLDQDGSPEVTAGSRVSGADGAARWHLADGTSGRHVSNAFDLLPARPDLELLAGGRAFGADGGVAGDSGLGRGFTAIVDLDLDGDPRPHRGAGRRPPRRPARPAARAVG